MVTKIARIAYERGYRVSGNTVISPAKKVLRTGLSRKKNGYPKFNIRFNGKTVSVKAHTLSAWQKYGEKCIGEEIVIRHKDDDKSNFSLRNIRLGTQSENAFDRYRNYKVKHYRNLDVYLNPDDDNDIVDRLNEMFD